MATQITIFKSDIRHELYAESTNAARTYKRQDGVSEFEEVVIDQQAQDSMAGVWAEAVARLTEKMHEFLEGTAIDGGQVTFTFRAASVPDLVRENILGYIVDWMMQAWLQYVRPDQRQQYIDRCTMQMDDLLRKLYKKEPPV